MRWRGDLSADQEGEAENDPKAGIPVMLWPDVANELADDQPVPAPLFFGCHAFGAMLVAEARKGGELEGERARTEAVDGEEGLPLACGDREPRQRRATAHAQQHGMWSSTRNIRWTGDISTTK